MSQPSTIASVFLWIIRLMLIITAFTVMDKAMSLSSDTSRDMIKVAPNSHNEYFNYETVPAGSLGASAGFAIMSGLCFLGVGMTFIRKV